MNEFVFKISGSSIKTVKAPLLVSGCRNTQKCLFYFDEGWRSFVKVAVFGTTESNTYPVMIDELGGDAGSCIIPEKAVCESGKLLVGVYACYSGEGESTAILRTAFVKLDVVTGAYSENEMTEAEQATLYEQALAALAEVESNDRALSEKINTFLHDLSLGKYRGEKGEKGDKGDTGERGERGERGEKGETGEMRNYRAGAGVAIEGDTISVVTSDEISDGALPLSCDGGKSLGDKIDALAHLEREHVEELVDRIYTKQNTLTAGENIIISEDSVISASVESDYDALENKPAIEGVTLEGNLTAMDLGLIDYDVLGGYYDILRATQSAVSSNMSKISDLDSKKADAFKVGSGLRLENDVLSVAEKKWKTLYKGVSESETEYLELAHPDYSCEKYVIILTVPKLEKAADLPGTINLLAKDGTASSTGIAILAPSTFATKTSSGTGTTLLIKLEKCGSWLTDIRKSNYGGTGIYGNQANTASVSFVGSGINCYNNISDSYGVRIYLGTTKNSDSTVSTLFFPEGTFFEVRGFVE